MKLFLDNIFSGVQLFYIRPHVAVYIVSFFFNFRFCSRKFQSQQKLEKKITHFTVQISSKNFTYFLNFNSLDSENICSRNTAKNLSDFANFPAKLFLFGARKKHLHCTISRRPRTAFLKHFERKCLHISVYPCKKMLVPET